MLQIQSVRLLRPWIQSSLSYLPPDKCFYQSIPLVQEKLHALTAFLFLMISPFSTIFIPFPVKYTFYRYDYTF